MAEEHDQDVIQPAWDLFCKGELGKAEQAAAVAAQDPENANVAPIPDIMILRAFYLCRMRRHQQARTLFGNVLQGLPDDAYAQAGYLLALQEQLVSEGRARDISLQDGILLLGLGTGRSGSTTLAKLWQNQENCYCSHEHPPRLGWKPGISRFEFHKRRFDLLQNGYRFVGDVSHWWLPYIENIMDSYQKVRIVVLKRGKEATVNSFLKVKGGNEKGAINHWTDHDGSYWIRNIWDECYPSYNVATLKEAIEHYWSDYYEAAESLVRHFPSIVRVFSTEQLGEADTQKEILSFCGFEEPQIIENLHLNEDGKDGSQMY